MIKTNYLDISNIINHIISITDLGRGKAAKVLNAVTKEKTPFIIFKNNKPQAVLVDIDIYNELVEMGKKYMEIMEEECLLKIAEERMTKYDRSKDMYFEDIVEKYGFSMEDIDAGADDVKIE